MKNKCKKENIFKDMNYEENKEIVDRIMKIGEHNPSLSLKKIKEKSVLPQIQKKDSGVYERQMSKVIE